MQLGSVALPPRGLLGWDPFYLRWTEQKREPNAALPTHADSVMVPFLLPPYATMDRISPKAAMPKDGAKAILQ